MSALPATGPINLPFSALPEAAPLPPMLSTRAAPTGFPEVERLDRDPAGRVLFVASSGGHFTELLRLSSRWSTGEDSLWVTFDTAQTRTLLAGRPTVFLPYVSPRDLAGAVRSIGAVLKLMRGQHFDHVVSTGAAVAVGAFVAARLRHVPTLYVESVARVAGPSLTGRIVAALRLAATRTQHPRWASRRWTPEQSVFSAFASRPRIAPATATDRPRLFVTLGTIRPYRFDALVDAVLATGLADERTVWQLGSTTRDDLPGRAVLQLGHDDFLDAVSAADVVITHAGVGTVLELLESGAHPVVVPRSATRAEHVDEHQSEIARYLDSVGIAEVVRPAGLSADLLRKAAALVTVPAR